MAQPYPVFISGTEGYQSFRIPALVQLPDHSLLAFCEGRVKGSADFGNIDIVLKRSKDGGKTWSRLQVVVNNDSLQAGNPAPVLDETDPRYPGGRLFLFYNTGNKSEGEVRQGKGIREVWYISSTDGGQHWSDPVNITLMVHRPNRPDYNPAYHFPEDWRSYANAPGHALQFRSGRYKGRIYVAANHSVGPPKPQFRDYAAHGFYTDDHGEHFSLSQTVPFAGSNESTAAELPGGRLLFNSRNQSGDPRQRIISLSSDGGQTWDSTYCDPQLPDPVCEGSLNSRLQGHKVLVVFSNPVSTTRRDSLSIRISYDGGRTWPLKKLVEAGPEGRSADFTAYSDLLILSRRSAGILYERNGYREIVFNRVRW